MNLTRPPRGGRGDTSGRARNRARLRAVAPLLIAALVLVAVLWATVLRPAPPRGEPSAAARVGSSGHSRAEDVQRAPAPRTVVSLTFNGGTVSQYAFARPVLRQFGVNGTFYVSTHRLDAAEACCMTWAQAQELYRAGDEIGGSGADGVDLTQPRSADPAEDRRYKEQQICEGHQRLRQLGLDPRSFAYPAGAATYEFPHSRDSLPDLVAACGYSSGRTVGGLAADGAGSSIRLPPSTPYEIRTPTEVSLGPIALAELQHSVEVATGPDRRWVPLVFGEVCHAGDPAYASCMSSRRPVEDTVLSAFLGWLRGAGEPGGAPAGTGVQTVRQVLGAPPQPSLPAPRTVVSLTFDDGDTTQVRAGQLLRSHRMHATFFVNSGQVEARNPYFMTWPQVLRLHRDGNEIGGHTSTHVDLTDPQLSVETKREEVCGDRRRLLQMGLDARSFAYPYGGVDPAAEDLVQSCGYQSARTAGGVSPTGPVFATTVPPSDLFATEALDGPGGTETRAPAGGTSTPVSLGDLQRAVVAAAEHGGGWVQVVLHRVCDPTDPQYSTCMASDAPIEEQTLGAFLDWLRHGAPDGTVVRTVRQTLSDRR